MKTSLPKHLLTITVITYLSLSPLLCRIHAETWHLKDGDSWQAIPDNEQGRYTLAVSNVKQLIAKGQTENATEALLQLQKDFAEITGPDLNAFIEAETLYSEGKWFKAIPKYDDFLDNYPESWLYTSALERQFSVSVAFLGGEKRKFLKFIKVNAFDEAETILNRIADRTGDAPIAKRALTTLAAGQEKNRDFLDAYETWAEISLRWPTGDTKRQAILGMARSLHSAYKGPQYDSASLISARSYYEKFKMLYPDHVAEFDIDAKLEMIEEQLAYKKLTTADYYTAAERPLAANLYYNAVTEQWPDSTAAKMAESKVDFGTEIDSNDNLPRNASRAVFDVTTSFLDNWFGLARLTSKENK